MKKKVINFFFPFILSLTFLIIAIGSGSSNEKNKSNSSSSSSTTPSSSSTESTTPSWTCKNCGGHSYHNHETVPDLKVCNSCGVGN